MTKWKVTTGVIVLSAITSGIFLFSNLNTASAAPSPGFNLQVTPSPLVETVKPGTKTTVQVKIRNAGTAAENLAIAIRDFTFDSNTGQVRLDDKTTPAVAQWITFKNPTFTVQPGQWFTEQLTIDVPQTAGFSYSFALQVSRQKVIDAPKSGQAINGSVAVFALVNVDRPGAKSELKTVSFTTDKKLYEYPPVNLTIRFNNTGNTILQPAGNIFIQRTASSKTPMATLTVNAKQSYILPGTQRSMSATWNDGFAAYQTTTDDKGRQTRHLVVNWQKFAQFRIGKYTASLVAVYNDNGRDVPVQGTVTFWIVPWRAILALIVIVAALVWFIRWRGKKRTEKAVKRALAAQAAAQKKAVVSKSHE